MRRVLAVAALAAALFAAGCGGSDPNTPGAGGPSPTMGATATGDASTDRKAICQSSEKIASEGLVTVLSEVGKMVAAEAQNNTTEANRARGAAEAAATKLASDIRAEAAKAQNDPELKAALETAATQFETMARDVKNINEQKLQAAGEAVTRICA